jgi:hypothetical protein
MRIFDKNPPSPDFSLQGHKKMTKSNYLSLSNIWWKSKSCGHAHLLLIYPCPSVRPSGYRYMVCPAISSYSFGATALIFCRMFIHIKKNKWKATFHFKAHFFVFILKIYSVPTLSSRDDKILFGIGYHTQHTLWPIILILDQLGHHQHLIEM